MPPGEEESLYATADRVLVDDARNAFLEMIPRDWMQCFIHAPEVGAVVVPSRPAASELKYSSSAIEARH